MMTVQVPRKPRKRLGERAFAIWVFLDRWYVRGHQDRSHAEAARLTGLTPPTIRNLYLGETESPSEDVCHAFVSGMAAHIDSCPLDAEVRETLRSIKDEINRKRGREKRGGPTRQPSDDDETDVGHIQGEAHRRRRKRRA